MYDCFNPYVKIQKNSIAIIIVVIEKTGIGICIVFIQEFVLSIENLRFPGYNRYHSDCMIRRCHHSFSKAPKIKKTTTI